MGMWQSKYIPIPTHEHALRATLRILEQHTRALIVGRPGLGKTTLATELTRRLSAPNCVVALARGGDPPMQQIASLARALGAHGSVREIPAAWEVFAKAVRVCMLQEQRVVLAIDDADKAQDLSQLQDLVDRLDPHQRHIRLVLTARRALPVTFAGRRQDATDLCVRLSPLTRSEAVTLVDGIHALQPSQPPPPTRAEITRVHALRRGVPGRILREFSRGFASSPGLGHLGQPPPPAPETRNTAPHAA